MTEYNLGFSNKLAEIARLVVDEGDDSFNAYQAATYLSLLSCEIALKAMLEKSRLPVKEIKSFHTIWRLYSTRCHIVKWRWTSRTAVLNGFLHHEFAVSQSSLKERSQR